MYNREWKYVSFCALWNRNRTMVWRICLRHSPLGALKCEDLVQEVVIALWNDYCNLQQDKGIGWEKSWVWWHTRTVLSHLRRRQRDELIPEGFDAVDEYAVRQRESKETVEDMMAVLTEQERRVVRMQMEGYDYESIAQSEGVTAASAKQIRYRAKTKMEKYKDKI